MTEVPRDESGRFRPSTTSGVERRATALLRRSLEYPVDPDEEKVRLRLQEQAARVLAVKAGQNDDTAEPGEVRLEYRGAGVAWAFVDVDGWMWVVPDGTTPELVGRDSDVAAREEFEAAIAGYGLMSGPPAGESVGEKARRWDPTRHPQDRRGRFLEVNGQVRLPAVAGGGTGVVTGFSDDGRVDVRRDRDGSMVRVRSRDLDVADPTNPAASPGRFAAPASRPAAGRVVRPATRPVSRPDAPEPRRDDRLSRVDRSSWGGDVPPKGASGEGNRKSDGQPYGTGYPDHDPRSDPSYDQYVEELDARLASALTEVGDTEALYDRVDGAPGAYRPERRELHQQILDDLMESYADVPREGRAVVLAGPPGAGKSTTIRTRGSDFGVQTDDSGAPANFATVNPDDMKEIMVARGMVPADYDEYAVSPGETASLTHEESSWLSQQLLDRLVAERVNVILDGTFAGKPERQLAKVDRLREDGYTVTGVLVDGSVERSLTNAGRRHRKPPGEPGGGYRGRYVPLAHIEGNAPPGEVMSEVFGRPHRNRSSINIESGADRFNGGIVMYDNSTGESVLARSTIPDMKSLDVKGNAERLRQYWTTGEGAAVIGWGSTGQFGRCVTALTEHMPGQAEGYCARLYRRVNGQWPGRRKTTKDDAPADVRTGVMVAFEPPADLAEELAVEGGLPPEGLHVTLAYLGKTDDVADADALRGVVESFAAESMQVSARVSGVARFTGGDDGDVVVALVESAELDDFRADLVDALTDAGFTVSRDHGFTPHITLTHLDPEDESPVARLDPVDVTFGWLALSIGEDDSDHPLGADSQDVDDGGGADTSSTDQDDQRSEP